MQGQNQQQAYDRGTSIFSPDGRLYQVEYAREAVKRGSACVGIRTTDGVVLAAEINTRSPLMESSSVEKLHKADTHIGIASAGHAADARQLVDKARQHAQVEQMRYDQPISADTLTTAICDDIQEYTQKGGTRPFGVGLLIGGIDEGEPKLFEVTPAGTASEWRATAIGANSNDLQGTLEEEYKADLSLDDGIQAVLRALESVKDDEFSAKDVSVATIDADSNRYAMLNEETVAEHLRGLSPSDE
ncbi:MULTISPECIES: archaeal proteasome endopeptidase complex subunit alpha [unclassified Haladaptatus]|uniref:archaeal proteasome endopeptidase complex subunit alpha n=1 Tax=unclassified Haladaptatus TaxID=2622732 RepID=UPI00209C2098|nr:MULTISPECIES: archaeal proteasome endopeptidase complex subunit alpha [unclassified Haladaptatus]MCO8244841.1 archaeal proteasome endopeptidase complex subunit alpha [Haladaptatus sp. AB643]MCO8255645.1 archaeal proteasome endopeptidase complex subunit alpha [Haladaptatus sp. AB618]